MQQCTEQVVYEHNYNIIQRPHNAAVHSANQHALVAHSSPTQCLICPIWNAVSFYSLQFLQMYNEHKTLANWLAIVLVPVSCTCEHTHDTLVLLCSAIYMCIILLCHICAHALRIHIHTLQNHPALHTSPLPN